MRERLRTFLGLKSRSRRLLGINARDRGYIGPLNPRRLRWIVDDKIETKERLEAHDIPVPKTYCTVAAFWELRFLGDKLDAFDDFVLKPSRGHAGSGIVVVVGRTKDGWRSASGHVWSMHQLRRHVGNILFGDFTRRLSDRALFEERLRAGSIPGSEGAQGLPDVRVIVHRGKPVMAMIRLPTSKSSGRANLHQGAVGVGLDIFTGKTVHATLGGRFVERHPDTDVPLVGQRFRQWFDVLDIATRAAAALPLGYVGVDIAVDDGDRPVVLELNVRPGIEIQNCNRKGLAEALSSWREEAQPEPILSNV